MVEISEEAALKELPEQASTRKPTPPEPVKEEIELKAADVTPDDEGKVIMDEPEKEEQPDVKEDVDLDKDIAFLENIRKVGRGKQQIETFMRQRYGIEVDRRFKLNELVDQAVAARRKELSKEAA